jgi:hypothetical protein
MTIASLVRDYKTNVFELQRYTDREFPFGCFVTFDCGRGFSQVCIVWSHDECPPDKLPLMIENGNIWFKEIERCTRIVNLKRVPPKMRRLRLKYSGHKGI